MIGKLVVVLSITGLIIIGCSQEQPPTPVQPKPQPAPAAEPATPAPPAVPAAPAPSAPAAEPAKPAVSVAEAPKTPAPVAPAAPAAPVAPAKPAAAAAPAAPAAPSPPPAPEKPAAKEIDVVATVILPASQGQVTLPHLVHAKMFPCATCHGDGTPGKIGLTKDTAHALCRDCHKAKGAGPTACGGCHKK